MRKLILIFTALSVLPATARAQQASNADARMQAALSTALEAGIPTSLLESKMAEGRAKGVAAERIAAAVETRLQALLRARSALERAQLQSTTSADLAIAADAIQAGVSETALIEINRRAPEERRAVAVAVLANLVALGHASENALARVSAAMNRGVDVLLNLQASTASELRGQGRTGIEVGAGVNVEGGVRIDLGRGRRGGGN